MIIRRFSNIVNSKHKFVGTIRYTSTGSSSFLPVADTRVGAGEYQVFYINESGSLYGQSGNLTLIGSNNSGQQGLPNLVVSGAYQMPQFSKTYGGLHDGAAIDVDGNVWHMGDNGDGQAGIGNTNFYYHATRIFTDISGSAFGNVVEMSSFFSTGGWIGYFAIKSDGTLWAWGNLTGGMAGDGTSGGIYTRPKQIIIPGGRLASKIVAGESAILLCTDGTVWTWGGGGCNIYNTCLGYVCSGNSWQSPQRLTNISGSVSLIAGGKNWNYAVSGSTIWGWGLREQLCVNTVGDPYQSATNITSNLNLPLPITKIVTNSSCTHAILSDGSLWGWGDNAEGAVGTGTQLDFGATSPPYAWDFLTHLYVTSSTRILPERSDFKNIYAANTWTYYNYFECNDGQLYFCGRNKTGIAGNGEISGDYAVGSISTSYPDSWNKPTPVPVNPFTVASRILVPSPYCVLNPTGSPCNLYSIPTNHPPTVNAGNNQSISTSTTTISGSALPFSGRNIATYVWSQISGPSYSYMYNINRPLLSLSNLISGSYTFRLTATDNLNSIGTDDVLISVS